MSRRIIFIVSLLFLIINAVASRVYAANENFEEGKIYVGVTKEFNSCDNPMQSEFIINGKTVDIFSAGTFENIDKYIKKGWNDIEIKTTPQEPANDSNSLVFRIGPMHRDPKNSAQFIMSPVLWQFKNDTDWKFHKDTGHFTHATGPDVKEIGLKYHVHWAGTEGEGIPLKSGDYVLQMNPEFRSCNSPVIATVVVNGIYLTSFLGADRQVVITPLLKPGKNEVTLISHRVKNSIEGNDMKGDVAGPAEWYADKKAFLVKPITSFSAGQGWTKEVKSGQLISSASPDADSIDRKIIFMVK